VDRTRVIALMSIVTVLTMLLVAGPAFGYIVTEERRTSTVSADTEQSIENILDGLESLFQLSNQSRRDSTSASNSYTGIIDWKPMNGNHTTPSTPVPEPGTILLLGISAAAGAGYFVRRARKI
jgi:hypothetical protein